MKLATFVHTGEKRVGVVDLENRLVLDVQRANVRQYGHSSADLADMLAVIDSGTSGIKKIEGLAASAHPEDHFKLDEVELAAPLPRPRQIRDFLLFEKHIVNGLVEKSRIMGKEARVAPEWYELPTYYRGNPSTVIGHEAEIQRPVYTELLDFELELGCIIGQPGRDIAVADATNHIFGYTIFNDVSARDMQFRVAPVGMGPGKGKDFDTSNVLGPWIVTADEVGDPYNLTMTARVNGEVWGSGTSGDMQFNWSEVIAFISQSETLEAGEVLGSGTVGTGCGLEQGRYLENGDVVELEVERIGTLRNRIAL